MGSMLPTATCVANPNSHLNPDIESFWYEQAPGQMPNISVYFTAFGVVTSVISTFLSSGFKRSEPRQHEISFHGISNME